MTLCLLGNQSWNTRSPSAPSKSCGRKLHQHLHTLFLSPVISVQFRVACLRTQCHRISISQQQLILQMSNSRCKQSCRNGLRMSMPIYIFSHLRLGLSVSVYKYNEAKSCRAIFSSKQIYLLLSKILCKSELIELISYKRKTDWI